MQFLAEVSKSNIAKIGKSINHFNQGKDRLFDHLFGDKKRIVIPIGTSDSTIADFLQQVQPLTLADLKKGYVTKKIQTQQGEKDRQVKIANYIDKSLLDQWSIVKDKLSRMKEDDYSAVITRYPLDILRMSDHDGIESCHSPSGEWYHCAMKEAQIGGAVAYAVRTADLEGVDLQSKDFFADSDRDISGVKPLARLRLRRFHNEAKQVDLLIPERRQYETQHVSGFKETVKKWAKEAQKDQISKFDPMYDYSMFNLRGGAYQDTDAYTIWNDFFGTSVRTEKKSIDQENSRYKMTPEEMEDQADNMIRLHRFNHVEVVFTANEDRTATWESWVEFEINKEKFINIPKEQYIVGYTVNGNNNLLVYLRKHYGKISKLRLQEHEEWVIIRLVLEAPSDWEENDPMIDFEQHLDDLDEIDKNYNEIDDHILFWFAHHRYMNNHVLDTIENNYYNFKHFKVGPSILKQNPAFKQYKNNSQSSYEASSDWMHIGDMEGITREATALFSNQNGGEFYIRQYPSPFAKFNFLRYANFVSSNIHFASSKPRMQWNFPMTKNDPISVRIDVIMDYNDENEAKKKLAGVKAIDRDWDKYQVLLSRWWAETKAKLIERSKKGEL